MSSSSLYQLLPQDVLDRVIFYLRGDQLALTRCAIASRSLLNPARRQLYHTLTLVGIRRKFAPIARNLLHQPDIISYVRILNLVGMDWEEDDTTATLPMLLRALAGTTALREFTLIPGHSPGASWGTCYSASIRVALFDLLRIPTLHTIRFQGLCVHDFPLEVLGASSALRFLELTGFHWYDSCIHPQLVDKGHLPSEVSRSHLTNIFLDILSVSISNAESITPYLSDSGFPIKLTRLRELRIDGRGCRDFSLVQQIVKLVSKTLESLMLLNVETRLGDSPYHFLIRS
jgi:hypothetical protein